MKRKDEIKIKYFLEYNYEAKSIASKLNQYRRDIFNFCFIEIKRAYKRGYYYKHLIAPYYPIYRDDYITIYLRLESKSIDCQKINNTPINISIVITSAQPSCQMSITVTNPNFWFL